MVKKDWYNLAGLIAGVMVYILVMNIIGIGCPIRYMTGISCMGCGMTRACISLLTLDVKSALYYHPLCILMPLFMIGVICSKYMSNRVRSFGIIIIMVLFTVVYLIRLADPENLVVQIDIQNGLLYKILHDF